MPKLNLKILLSTFAAVFLLCANAYASEIYSFSLKDKTGCNNQSVWLDNIFTAADYSNEDTLTDLLQGRDYFSSDCVGAWFGNDNKYLPKGENIGIADDGLLNSQYNEYYKKEKITDSSYFFTDESNLYDIDQTDQPYADDPGWIYLYGTDGGYQDVGPIKNLNEWLTITVNIDDKPGESEPGYTGTWSLETKEGIVEYVQEQLNRAIFTDLAIALKLGPYFAIYNFDFIDIFLKEISQGNDIFDQTTAYVFTGGFDVGEDFDYKGISHMGFWALDPPGNVSAVPEPATIFLFGCGLLGIAGISRRKK